jgi:DNA relaxase NicK
MIVDFCSHFLYFILNYSFLFFNRTGVGLSILFNFTNSFNEIKVTDETREQLISLDEKEKELTEHRTNIVNMKKYASDLQTFIAIKQIEKEVETQVGLSILFNFTNSFNHFFNQMLGLSEHG